MRPSTLLLGSIWILVACLAMIEGNEEVVSIGGIERIHLLLNDRWKTGKYFQNGSPIITKNIKYSFINNPFYFIPTYTVLETDLQNEDGIYVDVENISDISVHLYGLEHPTAPNYTFDLATFSIAKCLDETSCRKLSSCHQGLIVPNHKTQQMVDMLFIAWNATQRRRRILGQLKDRLIKCDDFYDPIDITKLVMKSNRFQQVSSHRGEFMYTEQQNETILHQTFNLSGRSLHLQVSQCERCLFKFQLKCGNHSTITAAEGTNYSKIYFEDNSMIHGWTEISILGPTDNTACSLTVITEYAETQAKTLLFDPYWAIMLEAYRTYEPQKKHETNISNSKKFITITMLVVCIVTGIAILVVFIRRKRRNSNRPFSPSDAL